ncbi:PQ loop repeat protein-like protein [Aaosphaeria arxii CBS 175.79]|uniref:PQ loop repeat protein-like protein n=1 Tax=Aaosphaeria arxii CBS 175.79 TaxID=1450172 RepID=A0A6A5XN47_9PLEO|nr:PQ loop repeat protein-like protein [Aaosphaeria arxii CBS 175.79]KAF2014552.1 PQ loop repeat protein-like protein [Aaosphaeria arxii CBS 175.79]
MAPQSSIPPAANVLGTIGTICWCVQLFPQIWRNYRTKSTEGLPAVMMFLWTISAVPFGVYAIVQKFNIPLIIQPQCFCVLCGVSWGQCMYYGRKWRALTTIVVLTAFLAACAGVQAGLVFAVRPAYARGLSWPVTTVGVVAFVLLISAYLPIPFELLKRRGRVVGIDFIFLTIDWCGAFFSLMSLVAQNDFDALFGTMYALCCVIEMSMVTSHLIWRLRTRGIRRRARENGLTFDEHDEGKEWQAKGLDIGEILRRWLASRKRTTSNDREEDQDPLAEPRHEETDRSDNSFKSTVKSTVETSSS